MVGSLLDRRLVIVTGKGGTGKTTVSAALAVAAAEAGRRVLIVEVGPDEQIPGLLEPGSPPAGYEGRELSSGLRGMRVDPFAALSEYLGIQLGVRALADLAVGNRAFRQLMSAAPGWRELITLGKIWHLAQQTDPAGRYRFELIVVDAPATGHGISFLDMPRVVISALRAGPLRDHSERVEQLIKDPDQTLVLPVALAEELPAIETMELVAKIRDEMGIPIDRVVVNAVSESPYPDGLDLRAALSRLDGAVAFGSLPRPPALGRCAQYLRARYALHLRYVEQIADRTGLPLVRLPLIAEGISGRQQISTLAKPLLETPTEYPR